MTTYCPKCSTEKVEALGYAVVDRETLDALRAALASSEAERERLAGALRRLVAAADEDIKAQVRDHEMQIGVRMLWSRERGEFLEALNTARPLVRAAGSPESKGGGEPA